MKIVTVDQMREIERQSEAAGVSTATLMENAGRAVAEVARRSLGDPRGKRVLVLVGPGNNGGDGEVAARHLHDLGCNVSMYLWSRNVANDTPFAATQLRNIPANRAEDDPAASGLRDEVRSADLIVDALLGTGKARPIMGVLKKILETVAGSMRPDAVLLAVDLPTGLNADSGTVDESCLHATITATLGFPKIGLLTFPGAAYVGHLEVCDIGLPSHLADDVPIEMSTPSEISVLLPPRPLDAHKGSFGKVMVAAGSINYVGAAALASVAAGRVGAGLVTLACARSLHAVLASKLTEVTFAPLPEGEPGEISAAAVQVVLSQLDAYDVLLLGPGIGRAASTGSFVLQLLRHLRDQAERKPTRFSCLIDADGLNALAAQDQWWKLLPPETILTPHSGEMARLLRTDASEVNAERIAKAREAAARWGAVVVLKGAFTIIAAPDGHVHINPCANPGLATAGTGDVLSGAIAGMLAQGLEPYAAALTGTYLHSLAGVMASEKLGDSGILASDLLPLLPQAVKEIKGRIARSTYVQYNSFH